MRKVKGFKVRAHEKKKEIKPEELGTRSGKVEMTAILKCYKAAEQRCN